MATQVAKLQVTAQTEVNKVQAELSQAKAKMSQAATLITKPPFISVSSRTIDTRSLSGGSYSDV